MKKGWEFNSFSFSKNGGPVNAILNLIGHFDDNPLPEGTHAVWSGEGEWNITRDVFRDLGIAFGAALVLIYILLLIETGSYGMPLIIMGAIPLTMIGIMPGFWLFSRGGERQRLCRSCRLQTAGRSTGCLSKPVSSRSCSADSHRALVSSRMAFAFSALLTSRSEDRPKCSKIRSTVSI